MIIGSKINQKQLKLLPSLLQKCPLCQLSQRGIAERRKVVFTDVIKPSIREYAAQFVMLIKETVDN
jgi:hypothetical protein